MSRDKQYQRLSDLLRVDSEPDQKIGGRTGAKTVTFHTTFRTEARVDDT